VFILIYRVYSIEYCDAIIAVLIAVLLNRTSCGVQLLTSNMLLHNAIHLAQRNVNNVCNVYRKVIALEKLA